MKQANYLNLYPHVIQNYSQKRIRKIFYRIRFSGVVWTEKFSGEQNLTQAQLDAIVQKKIGAKIAETKKEVYEETVNTVLALVLTLPLEVLMDHYWPKSYRERLPGFVDKVLEYYGRWEDGELDMDKLKEDLWEYGGIRLEPAQIDMEDISKNNEK